MTLNWQHKWIGYSTSEAEAALQATLEEGGVGYLEYLEGMEMGSGPHFQGYELHYVSAEDVAAHAYNVIDPATSEAIRRDSEFLEQKHGDKVSNALAVVVCDPCLRRFIERTDPQLLIQARDALGLPSQVTS